MGHEEMDAALEMLSAPTEGAGETEPAKETEAPKPAQPAEPPAPSEKPVAPEGNAGEQKLDASAEKPVDAANGWASLADDGAGGKLSLEEVKAQLADAKGFYAILDGKAPVSALIDVIKSGFPQTYAELQKYSGGEQKAADETPEQKRIRELEEWKGNQERDAQRGQTEAARKKTVDGFMTRFDALSKQAGLDDDDKADYSDWVSARLGRDPEAMKRLDAGNYLDVEKLFNQYHERMLGRVKRFSDAAVKSKQDRDRSLPKSPAGGSPPAPASASRKFDSRDDRLAEASRLLSS